MTTQKSNPSFIYSAHKSFKTNHNIYTAQLRYFTTHISTIFLWNQNIWPLTYSQQRTLYIDDVRILLLTNLIPMTWRIANNVLPMTCRWKRIGNNLLLMANRADKAFPTTYYWRRTVLMKYNQQHITDIVLCWRSINNNRLLMTYYAVEVLPTTYYYDVLCWLSTADNVLLMTYYAD